ncbi:MAG: DUF166 domain-containing protein [Proteobacteria bacterium]|nr:DUF166 domain-containing protein [Pseudomonadota bacterium]
MGEYGQRFGAPRFRVFLKDGKVAEVQVLRGAPCGATWEAAEKLAGTPAGEAGELMGLVSQQFCSADPSAWDPIYQKSPVHIAGHLHAAALARDLECAEGT